MLHHCMPFFLHSKRIKLVPNECYPVPELEIYSWVPKLPRGIGSHLPPEIHAHPLSSLMCVSETYVTTLWLEWLLGQNDTL